MLFGQDAAQQMPMLHTPDVHSPADVQAPPGEMKAKSSAVLTLFELSKPPATRTAPEPSSVAVWSCREVVIESVGRNVELPSNTSALDRDEPPAISTAPACVPDVSSVDV